MLLLSPKFWFGVAVGAAAGFTYARYQEAKGLGVPFGLNVVLKPLIPLARFGSNGRPMPTAVPALPFAAPALTQEQVDSLNAGVNKFGPLLPSLRPRAVMGLGHSRSGGH